VRACGGCRFICVNLFCQIRRHAAHRDTALREAGETGFGWRALRKRANTAHPCNAKGYLRKMGSCGQPFYG
jgi:hypothetical protein